MIVPVIIIAVGMYFFFAPLGLTNSFLGLILAHTALGAPFVVVTVSATLASFDTSLVRAAASLGAAAGHRVLPRHPAADRAGRSSPAALFAFATSFDEVVVVLFLGGPGSARCRGRCSTASASTSPRRSPRSPPS